MGATNIGDANVSPNSATLVSMFDTSTINLCKLENSQERKDFYLGINLIFPNSFFVFLSVISSLAPDGNVQASLKIIMINLLHSNRTRFLGVSFVLICDNLQHLWGPFASQNSEFRFGGNFDGKFTSQTGYAILEYFSTTPISNISGGRGWSLQKSKHPLFYLPREKK